MWVTDNGIPLNNLGCCPTLRIRLMWALSVFRSLTLEPFVWVDLKRGFYCLLLILWVGQQPKLTKRTYGLYNRILWVGQQPKLINRTLWTGAHVNRILWVEQQPKLINRTEFCGLDSSLNSCRDLWSIIITKAHTRVSVSVLRSFVCGLLDI